MALMCIILISCAFNYGSWANSSDIDTTKNNIIPPVEPPVVRRVTYNGPTYFQVSIWVRHNTSIFTWGSYIHICGGSLVSSRYVVSASQCVRTEPLTKPYHIYVFGGTDNLVFDPSKTFVSPVKDAKTYSFFEPNEFDNGVAVLQLVYPAPSYNPKIALIPMRSTLTKAGEKCQISGWGYEDSNPNILQNTTLTIVDSHKCNETFHGQDVLVTSEMLCGEENDGPDDSCKCDLGGPVVCNGELTGIILWGDDCGHMGFPGVYVSVAHYTQWILDTIKQWEDASKDSNTVLPTGTPQTTNNSPQSPFPPASTLPQPSIATKSTIHILTYAIGFIVIPIRM